MDETERNENDLERRMSQKTLQMTRMKEVTVTVKR
jgi:hypothetical protein